MLGGRRFQYPVAGVALDAHNALANQRRARLACPFEQQSVQSKPGKNRDRAIQGKTCRASGGSNEFAICDPVALNIDLAKKRLARDGFVREPAAARFFPGQFFIEESYLVPGASHLLGGKCAGGTAAYDRDLFRKHGTDTNTQPVRV